MEWEAHWPLPTGTELREDLLAAYGSTDRGYHDLRHLAEVLTRLTELAEHVDYDQTAVALAAWFHDGVYDAEPGAEERSALWAEEALPIVGLPSETVAEVGRLVRLTADHQPRDHDVNGCALSDADLAILASPAERYREYAADVRREYAHVPEPLFRAARAGILRQLLAKPTLFHTPYALAAWESDARSNVEAELIALERPD